MYVTLANKIKISLTARTKIYYLKVVRKVGMKLMGRPNGVITIKVAVLVLSGEEICTTLFHTEKCQV